MSDRVHRCCLQQLAHFPQCYNQVKWMTDKADREFPNKLLSLVSLNTHLTLYYTLPCAFLCISFYIFSPSLPPGAAAQTHSPNI